ncbi:MAG: DUF3383 family protein [Rickettsiaceae bacterium]|nr:DUF3383 family protein [Rickettsiaceae bacterium]
MRPSKIDVTIRETLVAGASRTQTTLIVDPLITKDGHRLTTADITADATRWYFKLDNKTANEEIGSFTGITDNTTTMTLTGVRWGYDFYTTANYNVAANMKLHNAGSSFIITNDDHYQADEYINKVSDQTISGVKTFSANPKSTAVPSDPTDLINKQYGDAIATAGITAFLVVDEGGLDVTVNAGYYSLGGYVAKYNGSSGNTLTDDTVNYVQWKDRALDINTSAFDNDAIPLAKVTTASGDITVLEDARAFITASDLKADSGLNRDANGIYIDLDSASPLTFSSGKLSLPAVDTYAANTAGYLVCGTASSTDFDDWDEIEDGSFRITIDGTTYNIDGLDIKAQTPANMDDVASYLQAQIRAATGGNETVVWTLVTSNFTITSGTESENSEVKDMTTSTGTVGTDLSGEASPVWINGSAGTSTAGTSNHGKVVKLDENGQLGAFAKTTPTLDNDIASKIYVESKITEVSESIVGWGGFKEQTLPISIAYTLTHIDYAFNSATGDLYIAVEDNTQNRVFITRYQIGTTGRFIYKGGAEINTVTASTACGITVYNSQVYVVNKVSGTQTMTRFELDLTGSQAITISGGSNDECMNMTNIGANFYLGSNTGDDVYLYTLSGTTLTRSGTISIAGGINLDDCYGLTTDGAKFYVIYKSGANAKDQWVDLSNWTVYSVAISGGTMSSTGMPTYSKIGIFPQVILFDADYTNVLVIEIDGSIPEAAAATTAASSLYRSLKLTKYLASEIGL